MTHSSQEKLHEIFVGETVRVVRSGPAGIELVLMSTDPRSTLVIEGDFELAYYGSDSVIPTEKIHFRRTQEKAKASMPKKITIEVDAPEDFLTFDLATGMLSCRGCCKKVQVSDDAIACRGPTPTVSAVFAAFTKEHGPCVSKHVHAAAQPRPHHAHCHNRGGDRGGEAAHAAGEGDGGR